MISAEQAAIVKGLLARGEKQQDIAAFFGENGGRINEIAKGHKHAAVQAAPRKDLPTSAALLSGFAIYQARQALLRGKAGIEAAMAYLDDYESDRDKPPKKPNGQQRK